MKTLIQEVQSKYLKNKVADIKSGDVVKIHQKIKEGNKERIQIYEGIVIKVHGSKNSLDGSFTVRRVSFGIGIERTFPFHLPTIVKIEKVKSIKTRQSRLYFLRNLTDKQIRRRGELKGFEVWEEKASKEEEEALKAKKEAAAKAKEEAKKKEQEELDKKFSAVRGEAKSVAPQQGSEQASDEVATNEEEQKNEEKEVTEEAKS